MHSRAKSPKRRKPENRALTPEQINTWADDQAITNAQFYDTMRVCRTSYWKGIKDGYIPKPIMVTGTIQRQTVGRLRAVIRGDYEEIGRKAVATKVLDVA